MPESMRFFASLRMTNAGIRRVVGQPPHPPLIKGGSFGGSVLRELNHQSPPFVKGDLGGFEEDRNQEVAPTEPEQTVRQRHSEAPAEESLSCKCLNP